MNRKAFTVNKPMMYQAWGYEINAGVLYVPSKPSEAVPIHTDTRIYFKE